MLYSHGENMRTWPHWRTACADLRPRLEHDRLQAAFQHMRGGGEADGTGAQDGDGLLGLFRASGMALLLFY